MSPHTLSDCLFSLVRTWKKIMNFSVGDCYGLNMIHAIQCLVSSWWRCLDSNRKAVLGGSASLRMGLRLETLAPLLVFFFFSASCLQARCNQFSSCLPTGPHTSAAVPSPPWWFISSLALSAKINTFFYGLLCVSFLIFFKNNDNNRKITNILLRWNPLCKEIPGEAPE